MKNFRERAFRKLLAATDTERYWINIHGSFRERELWGVIDRPNYLYGMLRAADLAKFFGSNSVTAIEFGVASGAGLLNMVEAAQLITAETGITFRIAGFDTGHGLPRVTGYKDHPEIWNPGDFVTANRTELERRIAGRADIIWGDIQDTIGPFMQTVDGASPIGFVSVDVDLYSATKALLPALTCATEKYIPAISMYFDDVTFFFANKWAGELAAIEEFNSEHQFRKIDIDRSLPGRRPLTSESWYRNMYTCHILDHPFRQTSQQRNALPIEDHAGYMQDKFMF